MPIIFTGTSEHSIDAKLRLSIPAKHRSQLEGVPNAGVWFAVPYGLGVIRLYPKATYEELSAKGMNRLLPDRDSSDLVVGFHGHTEQLEVDAQGRVGFPKWTIEDAALVGVSEVVIVGSGSWLEVRDRAAWQAARRARVAALPDLVTKIQREMRQDGPK
jgi:division/cell wall cluster transcriptional repressor MraZ